MSEKFGPNDWFTVGEWLVQPEANQLSRGEEIVRLEPKVMRVLVFLATTRGQVVSRRELEANVWSGMVVTDDALTNSIIKLRRALGDDARDPRYIETIAKSGYRLVADTERVPDAPKEDGEIFDTSSAEAAHRTSIKGFRYKLLVAACFGLAAVLAVWLFESDRGIDTKAFRETTTGSTSIAVLPFENLSNSAEQDYFSDGITEDLITDLSKVSGLKVVARNSVFAYRGSTKTEQTIGSELGVRYIVKGSVRRASDRLRINVRLTDTVDSTNRWADRYDRKLSDIFDVQDEILRRVVSALRVELSSAENKKLIRNYATSVEAYDLFLRGLDHYGRRSGEDNRLARELFEQAIAVEPRFARAYAGLALTYTISAVNGWGVSLEQSLSKAEELALKAQSLDENLPQALFVLGEVEMYRRNYAKAVDVLERALMLKPSYPDAYALLAWVLHFAGRPTEGLTAMEHAIDLNPRVPGVYFMVLGALKYELMQIPEAIELLERAVQRNPNYQLARVFLAAALSAAGKREEAEWQIMEVLALNPSFSIQVVEKESPINDPVYQERFLHDLQRAGLPR